MSKMSPENTEVVRILSKVSKNKVCFQDYAIIMPIRTLMMRRRGDPDWDLVWMHMSHQDARDKSAYWTQVTDKIVEKLKIAIRST